MELHNGIESSPGQANLKRRLGRGLSALLGHGVEEDADRAPSSSASLATAQTPGTPSASAAAPSSDEISIELIERNPFQPRREFDPSAIDELADSIRRHGVLQPLLVRPKPGGEAGYQLIAGERRWRAAQQVGLDTIPCRVIDLQDQQVCEASLEENLKRQDLNVLEKAEAFKDYLDRFGGTIEELGRQLSLNRATVSNMMRLLELPQAVQTMLRADRITAGHARAILPLSETQQCELALQIEAEQISVRRTEEIVREALRAGAAPLQKMAPDEPATTARPQPSTHVLSLQDYLRQHLGARIDIRLKKNDAGQIVIHFGNNDDFDRIMGQLRKAS